MHDLAGSCAPTTCTSWPVALVCYTRASPTTSRGACMNTSAASYPASRAGTTSRGWFTSSSLTMFATPSPAKSSSRAGFAHERRAWSNGKTLHGRTWRMPGSRHHPPRSRSFAPAALRMKGPIAWREGKGGTTPLTPRLRERIKRAMKLDTFDWIVLVLYGIVCVAIGLAVTRRAGEGRHEFFLSGRRLPWWLLGVSLVATTFSTDTPNLITDLVRSGGVSQNWVWWAFAVTGMCTVFFYAKLWRRSAALTDIAFYEVRYSGKPAAFLRGFRAIYLGVFFNVMIMASVNLSATKIAGVLLGWDRQTAVLVGGAVTVLYAASSGLSGVVLTDFVQFLIAMVGSVMAAVVALGLPEVGGLSGLFAHPAVAGRLSLLPDFSDWSTAAAVLVVPLAVQWWSTWYPGAEPGGGGYVAQRMLAAPTERDAMRTTLLFNVLHYAVRPWPGSSWRSRRSSSIPTSPPSPLASLTSTGRSYGTTWPTPRCSCISRTGSSA